ncbi:MAG: response regulator [Fibrobacteria bacterium]|nr:response regulator [Fibrobacteria bacterium]
MENQQNYTEYILRSMTDMLIVTSPLGIVQSVNNVGVELLGYDKQVLTGMRVEQLLVGGNRQIHPLLEQLVSKGRVVKHDAVLKTKARTKLPVTLTCLLMRGAECPKKGALSKCPHFKNKKQHCIDKRNIICIATDLTEQNMLLETLKKSEREKQERIKELTGLYELNELLNDKGKSASEVFDVFTRKIVPPSMQYTDKTYCEVSLDGIVYTGCVKPKKITSVITVPITINGKNRGKLVVGYINKKVKFIPIHEQELVNAYTHQISRYIERKELEAHLRLEKEKAVTFTKSKSDFLANMSHEIRTPMSGVIGMTDLLLSTELRNDQEEYARTIKDCSDNLLNIINDVLDFSKIEAGKLDFESIPFSLRHTIATTIKGSSIKAYEKGLKLIMDVDTDVPDALVGDPGRLRQVLLNLFTNAIKFTPTGTITVGVRIQEESKTSTRLHFSVSDTGSGIPADKQELIFQAFSQSDTSISRQYGGTGLGLSISTKLVQMMGGKIWLESEEDKGSTFHFSGEFILQKNAQKKLLPAQEKILKGLPVLLVDDNPTNLRILEKMLQDWGVDVRAINSPEEALHELEKTESRPVKIIITDSYMPVIDGFSLAEKIRKNKKLAQTKIAIVTSGGRKGDGELCRKLGINAYLLKPVIQEDLIKALLTVLGGSEKTGDTRELITRHSLQESKSKLNILLAEDNNINQKFAVKFLTKMGHWVKVANNGKEAIALFNKDKFDVVLMDVHMPEMNGFEATAIIKEQQKQQNHPVPIIALTAASRQEDMDRCTEAGMDGFLSKPISINKFAELLAQFQN